MSQRVHYVAASLAVGILAAGAWGGGAIGSRPAGDSGGAVTIFGAFVDAEAERFEQVLAPFEESSGIDVQYEGTVSFNDLVRIRAEADDLADIVVFPQPGLLAEFARDGRVVELNGEALDAFENGYSGDWQELGSVDGIPYGIWFKAAIKSLVWYPIPEFEGAGYEIPTTWDQLLALSERIVEDGGTPWCVGIESGEATGWVATDWIEDILLRLHGPDVYDQWVNHDIPFDDPRVVEAAEMLTQIWLNPDFVNGGAPTILTTPFGDAPRPLFDNPPGCFLHRQATFITSFFPDDVQASLATDDPQVGVFLLPPINDQFPSPVVGAGDVAGMTDARPEVLQVMAYLADPDAFETWAEAGGYFSPHQGFDTSRYPTDVERQAGQFLAEASDFRFDGSDLMPAEVGAGSFWAGMVDLVSGDDAAVVLADIETQYPGG